MNKVQLCLMKWCHTYLKDRLPKRFDIKISTVSVYVTDYDKMTLEEFWFHEDSFSISWDPGRVYYADPLFLEKTEKLIDQRIDELKGLVGFEDLEESK